MIKYLSPTSISLFLSDPELFYMRYMSSIPLPYTKQTEAMALGSAFDARIKGFLNREFLGTDNTKELFESQVDASMQKTVLDKSHEIFRFYVDCGALSNLLIELRRAVPGTIKMESKLEGAIFDSKFGQVIIHCRPDLHYMTSSGVLVVLDWKVNGVLGNGNTSPKPGYIWSSNKGRHSDCVVGTVDGVEVNTLPIHVDWSDQLTMYSWIVGKKIGAVGIVGIDQIVGSKLRVASFRHLVDIKREVELVEIVRGIWERCNSGHFFPELSLAASENKCSALEKLASSGDAFLLADYKDKFR